MLALIIFKTVDYNDDDDHNDDETSTLEDLSRTKNWSILEDLWPQKTIIIIPPMIKLEV